MKTSYNFSNLAHLAKIVEYQEKRNEPYYTARYSRILENIGGSLIMQALKNHDLLTTERTALLLLNKWEKAKYEVALTAYENKFIAVTYCGINEFGMVYYIPLVRIDLQ